MWGVSVFVCLSALPCASSPHESADVKSEPGLPAALEQQQQQQQQQLPAPDLSGHTNCWDRPPHGRQPPHTRTPIPDPPPFLTLAWPSPSSRQKSEDSNPGLTPGPRASPNLQWQPRRDLPRGGRQRPMGKSVRAPFLFPQTQRFRGSAERMGGGERRAAKSNIVAGTEGGAEPELLGDPYLHNSQETPTSLTPKAGL